MKRPKDKQPPENWFASDFDDSEWGTPGNATCGHWPKALGMGGIWHKSAKYNFYRIRMPAVSDIENLLKMDGVLEATF